MKKLFYTLIAAFGILMSMPILTFGQDARFFKYQNYLGTSFNLNSGDVIYVNSDSDDISVDIISSSVGVKVTKVDGNFNPLPILAYYFFYTERDVPAVYGTDQYTDINLRIECIPKANSWQELPQPQIYVPFDISSANPNPDNDHLLEPLVAGHHMLVLRRAFIWENSEAIGGFHGPYGDVKLQVGNPNLLTNTEEQLHANWTTLISGNLYDESELPGPIWSGYAPIFYPDPYDEWIDGPFGCIYSNIKVWDWSVPGAAQSVGIFVTEADSPNEFLGKSQSAITPAMQGEILVRIWGFGFVVLENIIVPASGQEPQVDDEDVYWYGGWDGQYPVSVYNPSWATYPAMSNPAVPIETSPGKQFKPFKDADFWSFHNNPSFFGYSVGLLGGSYPTGTYDKPHSYHAVDGPVYFGQ